MTSSTATPFPSAPADAPGAARAARAARRWPGLPNELVAGAVLLVVVLVSIPELRQFVVRSNDHDARAAVRLLAALDAERGTAGRSLAACLDDDLRHRLPDLRVVADPRAELAYHGYYFARISSADGPLLVAWPQEAGRSGRAVYAFGARRGLLAHPNADGRWSCLERAPRALVLERWRALAEP